MCNRGDCSVFSPTLIIDGVGAQHISEGRLAFRVELDLRPYYVIGSVGPGPERI
jgi:hypothetical protein